VASAVETIIRKTVGAGIGVIADFNRKRLSNADHPFLNGIHAPMAEEKTLVDLPVTGMIPPELDGRYLRIGPNPVSPDPAGYHWFTGDGMVHGIAVKGGKALWYRNRWIGSKHASALLDRKAAPGPRHGGSDTVNTNILGIGGRTFALVEAGSYPVELSDTLDEQTYNPFDDTLLGSFTAHPHLDPLTGEHHAIAYEATDPTTIRHVVLSAEGNVVREEPITVCHGPSIHDCAITARYAVILDLPVTFSMKTLIAGHSFPYAWNPEHRARVGLLPRGGGNEDVMWCDVDPCYVFHVANAYDAADGSVVMDVVAYATMFADSTQGPDAVGHFERWTIDPVAQKVSRRVIDRAAQEFPRPDERRFGLPYRYAYTMALPEDSFTIADTRLYKHDLETGTRTTHDFGPGRHPGEFVFVPASADAGEDEGWLIGLVINLPAETTDLVILDARDIAAAPIAGIQIPHRVPPGFHGNWIAAAGRSEF
jgi:carotenoid cleavage dioxygenase-like enzyme